MTSSILVLVAIIRSFPSCSAGADLITNYTRMDHINCSVTENLQAASKLSCAKTCSKMDAPCLGFGFAKSLTSCSLCLACPNATSLQTFTADHLLYSTKATDFVAQINEDLLIHVPMDSISGGLIPAVGTSAVVHGSPGPSVTVGKHGNAIFTPNVAKHDTNSITLGSHVNDCLGNISLCQNGMTFSMWFKVTSRVTDFSHPFSSTSFLAFFHCFASNYEAKFSLFNETHRQKFTDMPLLFYGEWHHVGITYAPGSGFEVFIDGCTPFGNTVETAPRPLINRDDFYIGCDDGSKCMRGHYDDLRFWTVKKTKLFMWWLPRI